MCKHAFFTQKEPLCANIKNFFQQKGCIFGLFVVILQAL